MGRLMQEASVNIRFLPIALFLLIFPLVAHASVAGDVEYLSGEAWIERSGEKVSLKVGDTVDAGDVVVTTQSGRVKLIMKDDSKVYVGSQSRITIDNYEMRGGSLFSGSFNMLWGKVRFLVTKLKKGTGSFDVHTKTATIGVRGTQFAVMLNKPAKPQQLVPTTVMLFEGAVVGKSIKGQVANIKPGTIVRLKPDGAILTRKIEKHDMRVLDIEPLALGKGLRPLRKGTALSSPTRLGTKTLTSPTKLDSGLTSPTRLDSTTTLTSPTKLDSTTTLISPTKLDSTTTLISPTTLESATLLKDPTLSTTTLSTTTLVKDPTLSTTTTLTSPTKLTAPTTTTITSPTTTYVPPPTTTITSPTRTYVPPPTTTITSPTKTYIAPLKTLP